MNRPDIMKHVIAVVLFIGVTMLLVSLPAPDVARHADDHTERAP